VRTEPERRPKHRLTIGSSGRAILASSLLVLLFAGLAAADDRAQFALETGLDIDLVGVIQLDVGGTELTVVFVFINERTFASKISPSLRATLLPYVGRNAFYVNPNIKTVVSQFGFDPLAISVRAGAGETVRPGVESWVEITPGFLQGRFDVNPAGASQGSGAEGILILGDAIDADEPFDIYYGSERASFAVSSSVPQPTAAGRSTPTAATTSHDPIEVSPLEDVTTLEELLALPGLAAESIAAMFALPAELVRTAEVEYRSEVILRFVFIRLEDAVQESTLGDDLLDRLEPLVGTGAVMVWAYSPTGADFSPWNFFVQQAQTNYVFFSSASFVELTAGFVRDKTIGAGEMAAAVIRLPRGVDPAVPFAIVYSATKVTFP